VARALAVLHPEGQFEVRCIGGRKGAPSTLAGVFDNTEDAWRAIEGRNGKYKGIYFTLNPTTRPITNKLEAAREATRDEDISARRWLLIDIEGARSNAKASNATNQEVLAAIHLAERIRSEVTSASPLVLCSGNGCHLLYKVDLPNDKTTTELVKRALKGLAHHYSTPGATVDTTVSNASRISKLPGTMTRKGEHTEDRPQRYAFVLNWEVSGVLPAAQLEAWAALAPGAGAPSKSPQKSPDRPSRTEGASPVERARLYLEKREPAIEGQGGNDWTLTTAGHIVRGFDLADEDALTVLLEWNARCQPPWSHEELSQFIQNARKYGDQPYGALLDKQPTPALGRPDKNQEVREVVLSGSDDDKAAQILAAIVEANEPLTAFVLKPDESFAHLTPENFKRIKTPADLAYLYSQELKLSFFSVNSEGEKRKCTPSNSVLDRVLAYPTSCTGLPMVQKFTKIPMQASDGTLILKPGLHPSGVYYQPSVNLPEIPTKPTEDETRSSLELLDFIIADFPFASPEDRQAFFGYLFSGAISDFVPHPWPLFNFSASRQGSGKSILAGIPLMIFTGSEAPPTNIDTNPQQEGEIRKKLTSALSSESANGFLVLDNIKGKLQSPALEAFVTASFWQDRKLTTNINGVWPISLALAITGNNLELSEDLERRQVLIRLTPDVANPSERKDFRIPFLLDHIKKHRTELLHAVLVLLQRWISLGHPRGNHRMGSFESWSASISGLLDCIGVGSDFLARRRKAVDTPDPGQDLMQLWFESTLERSRQQASQLVRFAKDAGLKLSEEAPASSLGRFLIKRKDRVFEVLRSNGDTVAVKLQQNTQGRNSFWSLLELGAKEPDEEEAIPRGEEPTQPAEAEVSSAIEGFFL